MKRLAVTGPSDSGKTTVVESLVARLSDEGAVATVKHMTHAPDVDTEGKDTARHRAAGAAQTVGIADDGSWFATGDERTLAECIEAATPEYDYLLAEGFSQSSLPKVVLGERPAADPVVATAPHADALDLEAVLSALEAQEPYETLPSLVARAKATVDSEFAGAIATFTGRVREREETDETPTKHLEFEKYEDMADERMASIREELCEREGVYDVQMHHRTGVVDVGENVVYAVVLAGHADEAFATISEGVDRLQEEVPIFKKEVTVES